MTRQAKISYWFILLLLLVVGWLHLATPLLAVLFSYFALTQIQRWPVLRNRWMVVATFAVVLLGIAYAVAYFIRQTIIALPKIADTAIPSVIAWAEGQGLDLPFTDYQSLRAIAMETLKEQAHYLGNAANFARGATAQFVFLIIGCIVAASLYLNSQIDLDRAVHRVRNNLYSLSCEEIAARFRAFYHSFATVMGAQIVISSINTILTSIFVVAVRLPHAVVVVGVTFLCGLLPVLGNLISNAIIVALCFTISPKMALAALIFLIVIHKLEYFLNSKIIGDRIRNPVWLTLLGLILGEKLMGIPGMILAPVVLNYLKVEASQIEVSPPPSPPPQAGLKPDHGPPPASEPERVKAPIGRGP
jgi:predicted PurR-regulated permease PerM